MGAGRTEHLARSFTVAYRAVMLSELLPPWAPNLHPIVVHFPIAWLTAALIVDLIALVLPRAAWAETMASAQFQ